MTDKIRLTTAPVQITDGSNYAHMTVEEGYAGYADTENSNAFHRADRVMTFGPPFTIWIRAEIGKESVVTVTKANE